MNRSLPHTYIVTCRERDRGVYKTCMFMLQSPPNVVTVEKRREAESIFLDLKKWKAPYDACKFILGEDSKWCMISVCSQLKRT